MRSEFLKIAGVKSEAEFYKKFPSEEAFMKKHGKALKKLKAKSGGSFKAHKMYGPKGEVKTAKTLKEHLALKKKGWGHNPPKAKGGDIMSKFGDVMNSDAVQNWGVPIVSDALEISDQIKAQKEALGSAKQERQISDIALQASKTTPEKVDRSYVRPEDFTNTGEEFFPVYGVGTNALAKHGGTYKAQDGVTNPLDSLSEYEYAKNTTNTHDPRGTMSTYGAAYIPEKEMDSLMGVWNKHKKNVKQTYNQFNSAKSEDFENLSLEDLWKKRNVARNQVLDEAESTNTEARAVPMRMITDQIRGAREKYLPEEEQVSNYYSKQIDSLANSYSNYDNISKQIMLQKEKESGLSEEELTKRWKEVTQNQDGGNTIKKMTPFKEYLKKYPKADTLHPPGLVLDRRYQTGQRDDLNQAFQDTYSNYLPDWERFDTENNGAGPGIRRTNNNPPPQKNGGFYKAQDGGMFNGEYMPLVNPNQQKSFGQGGYLKQAEQGFTSFDAGNASYGGGMYGAAGSQLAGMVGVNDDAGSNIGGTIGGTIGSAFGPLGSAVGGFLGSAAGDLLDRNDRRQRLETDATARNNKEMAYGSVAPAIQAGYSSHVRDGGNVPSYRSGGSMRGDYVSPNPSALDTMKMGGNLKTLWGGKAETVSYNPYAGGESIQFKGNSHDYRDPSTGQTGIGVAYGDDAKKMSMGGDITSNASVEVENEPAQEIDDSLVVYGDMKIPEEYISEIGDERAKGKKYKNYVANVLNKDEVSINRTQAKVADLGLESDDTVFGQLERRTADVVLKGADMKLKNIAEKKSILADLQEAMNETFDDYGIKANEFINKRKLVEDPMRIENAKYGARLKMGEDGVETTGNETTNPPSLNDFDKKQIPLTDMTVEELKAAGYKVDPNNPNVYIRRNPETNTTEAVEMSGSSLGYTPEGQAIDPKTSFAGGVTQKDYDTLKENNPWFDWDKTDPNNMVTYKGKKVSSAILKFQKEFNKRAKEAGIDPVKVDGIFGQETRDAVFTPAKEAEEVTNYTDEKVMLGDTDTTTETTTVAPKGNIGPGVNFNNSPEDQSLDKNQLLGEYYAMATNQVQPVQAQGFQPQLRVPYDISLQDMRNDVTSQSRAMQRNATLQNNPAALALAQAPTYDALNKINAEEFRQNQAMKDNVYSGNQATLNDAMLKNLGIYDQQADRQAQAAANTRTQNIDILNSISDKYSKNKLENVMNKVYANMYPTFKYDKNQRLNVVNPTQFNTGQGMTGISPLSMAQGITGGNQGVNNAASLLSWFSQNNPFKKEIKEEEGKTKEVEELEEIPESGKYGKKVTKNNKNSNILRAIRNL